MSKQLINQCWCLPRPKKDHYPGGMPLYAEEWLLKLARKLLSKDDPSILSLFAGKSKYGFRVDIKEETEPDLLCDVHELDNHLSDMFDIVIADPPYSNEESKKLYGTGHLQYKVWSAEAAKRLNPGGLFIVYHKLLMPNPNPAKFSICQRVCIINRTYHTPRVALYFKKRGNE